jgi:hypothetical protein
VLRLALVALLLLASAASAETVWLRGRGSQVWIEVDGRVREPQSNRKGFTRVSSPSPVVLRSRVRRAAPPPRRSEVVVHLGPPDWLAPPHHVHDAGHPVYTHHHQRGHARHARYGRRGHSRYGRHHVGHQSGRHAMGRPRLGRQRRRGSR